MRRPEEDLIALHLPFERTMRGFEPRQVLDHIESLEGQLGVVAADRDAALAQLAALSALLEQLRSESSLSAELRRERDEVAAQAERLRRSPVTAASGRIQQMLQLAEDEAAEVLDHAHAEADRLLEETAQRCAQLEAEAQQRIEAGRSRETDRVRAEEAASIARLGRLLEVAGAQLGVRVAEAEQVIDAITQQQEQARRELDATREEGAAIDRGIASAQHLIDDAIELLDSPEDDEWAPVPAQRDTSRSAATVQVGLLDTAGSNGRHRTG